MKSAVKVLVSVIALTVGACAEDLSPLKAQWEKLSGDFKTQIDNLKKQGGDLDKALAALPAVSDPSSPFGAARAKLEAALKGQAGALGAADGAIAKAKTAIEQAVTAGKLVGLQTALDSSKTDITGALKKAADLIAANKAEIANVSKLGAAEVAEREARGAAMGKLAKEGGKADFSDIDFKAGTAEFSFDKPASKATLDALVGFAKACPELRFNLVGHTSRDGDPKVNQKLSEDRAAAVKKYLLDQGVDPKVVVKTSGLGSTKTLVPEPTADSKMAAEMDPKLLAEARNKNRRVEVNVATHCK